MQLTELKVKIYSLAEEAKYIRKQERKAYDRAKLLSIKRRLEDSSLTNKQVDRLMRRARGKHVPKSYDPAWVSQARADFWSLRYHRTGIVRREARHSLLAYAFLRGRTRASQERPNSRPPQGFNDNDFRAACWKIADRFGTVDAKEFEAWWKA